MDIGPLRWATSEGVFLFRVPDQDKIIPLDTTILLSSSLYAISVFFDKEEITLNDEKLAIVRLNFHAPFSTEIEDQISEDNGYIIHSSFKDGLCLQSIFHSNEIAEQSSEFEKAFLDSVVNNVLETLYKAGRRTSDILFLQNRSIIDNVESMLHDIDSSYKTLADSWLLSARPDTAQPQFIFTNVLYNGKIRLSELFYDLADRAIESFSQLILGEDQKLILFRIAKSLVNLSELLFSSDDSDDKSKFAHSEIIFESVHSKRLYRLDVRSYDIADEPFCDITVMSN